VGWTLNKSKRPSLLCLKWSSFQVGKKALNNYAIARFYSGAKSLSRFAFDIFMSFQHNPTFHYLFTD